jgi:hypothetical protein
MLRSMSEILSILVLITVFGSPFLIGFALIMTYVKAKRGWKQFESSQPAFGGMWAISVTVAVIGVILILTSPSFGEMESVTLSLGIIMTALAAGPAIGPLIAWVLFHTIRSGTKIVPASSPLHSEISTPASALGKRIWFYVITLVAFDMSFGEGLYGGFIKSLVSPGGFEFGGPGTELIIVYMALQIVVAFFWVKSLIVFIKSFRQERNAI